MRQEITIVYAEADKSITIMRVDGLRKDVPASVHPQACHNVSSLEVVMKLAGWYKIEQKHTSDMHQVVTYARD